MATLTFGPEWLRNLTSSGSSTAGTASSGTASTGAGASSTAPAPSASAGSGGPGALAISSNPATRYKQAERRYGREEMLAHYQPTSEIPVDLQDMQFIVCIKSQPPLALEPMSNDEQNLLLQCVNSIPMMRTTGRGTNSGRGGRGEYDRGRGRGRGREEDGLGKMRNRDNWDDRGSKGFDRGFSMYGADDGPLGASPREVSRSISIESWRDNRQHVNDEEIDSRKPERDRWGYDGPKDRYGPKNWREPRGDQGDRHDFDDSRPGRPPTEAIRKIEYMRSRSSGSTSFDDEAFQNALPEWSTTNPQEVENVGTFDSTGAFMTVKENSVTKSASSAVPPRSLKDANGKSSSATSSPDLPPIASSNPSNLSSSDVHRLPPSMKDSGPPPPSKGHEVFNGLVTGSSSSASLSPVQPPLRLDACGPSFQQMPIDNVNKRTVDGVVSERSASALQKQSGSSAGVTFNSGFNQTADITGVSGGGNLKMDSLSMPGAEQAATNVVDFVSKWTAESEANLLGRASQVDDLGNDQWFYRDPQGDIQGPFTNAEMNDWLRTGYFTMSLLVRRGYEGDFCRLGEMIKTLGYVPFDPRPAAASTVYNNPPLPLAPVVPGLSQQHQLQQQLQQKQQLEQQLQQKQQLEQQLQQKQQLEQLRKIQHQQLLAMQQQHQGLLKQDYIRHIQMLHQQQLQQLQLQQQLQHSQQPQPRMPQLHVQDGFGLMMSPHDPMFPAGSSALPLAGIHPAALASSSELYARMLQQPAMTNPAAGVGIPCTVPATVSIPSRPEVTVSSRQEIDVPTTVEQIEHLQFLELEKEREDRRTEEMQRLERGHLEEERRIQERIVEEIRQQKLDEMRRVEFERKQLEEERRKLGELQRLVEQDRLLMAQKNQAEKLEREQRLKEKLEEERLEREHLEQEQLERERLQLARMEGERVKLEQKKLEEQRGREAEARKKQDELEAKQRAEAKKEAEARQKAEAEAKQRAEAEARKRAEAEAQQRAEVEAKQREEDERKKQLQAQAPAKSPWSSNNGKAKKGNGSNNLTLAQIQEAERMQQAEEELLRQLEQQRATAAAVAMEQSRQTALTWTAKKAPPPVKGIPSLLEIQQEQAKQLQEGGYIEKAQLLSTKVAESVPVAASSAAVWKSGVAPPVQWNKGGGGSGIWQTQEPIGRKKTDAPPADNNSQFPALGSSSSAHPVKKTSAKAEKVITKTKKEEAVVQKLFEVTKVRDELTEWCEDVLGGLRTSVDIPTLVDLLKDIDSPQEVTEYARMYLGESKQVKDFTQQFLERRSKLRNSSQKQKPEENPWLPAPQSARSQPSSAGAGVNHQVQQAKPAAAAGIRAAAAAAAVQKPVVQDDGDKSKGKKKKKMQKIDSSILGFNVCADSDRKNVGQIDKV